MSIKHFRFQGLSSEEVLANRQKYGVNVLTPPQRDPWWKLYLEKFDDPVIRILMIAAIIAIGVGTLDDKYVEGLGIVIAILLATTLAFVNEYKANQEFDVLNQVNDEVPVKVVRSGNLLTVPKRDVVVGDVTLLELGEEIPADGDLLESFSLQVNESRLTGESLPVGKNAEGTSSGHETAYPSSKLLRGTIISEGTGVARITAVGDSTEIGKTARAAAEETGEQTPLSIQLEKLSKIIGVVGFLVATLLFVSLVIRGVVREEIHLDMGQWYFVGNFTIGMIVALIPLWVPILYDAFEILKLDFSLPAWLEKNGLWKWALSFLLGASLFGIGFGIGYVREILSLTPSSWVPLEIAKEFLKYFMIAVTIIVVAVPEGLAMSVTLSLAYSMRKMIASNVLVRKMHACETIGAATVICTDKTGTLTLNQMKVQEAHFPCLEDGKKLDEVILYSICANSTAHLGTDEKGEKYLGNPTEGALLFWLEEKEIDYLDYRNEFKVIQQVPFSTDRKYMATLGHPSGSSDTTLYVKGAPEIILEHCSQVLTDKGPMLLSNKAEIEEMLKERQQRGMRTLGFACSKENFQKIPTLENVSDSLIWLGFVAIADALRPEIPDVISACKKAGINVKVVTGDNPTTAREIARQIGLLEEKEGNCLTGDEFSKMSDEKAADASRELNILSRAKPLDKLRLVRLLKEKGEVVAVTGDGTNDAPALNYANVGLSMGKTGTAVAKEASDIVILDDSFTSVVNAVMWGRSLYQNIQKFILFQITINVAALGIALLGPFIGVKLPFTVTQMLWVNLIMDTFAALALSTEPPRKSVMDKPPRDPQSFIITKTMAANIFTVAFLFLAFLVGLLVYIQKDGAISDYELSVFFTLFVLLQFWNLFNAKCLEQPESVFTNFGANPSFLSIALCILLGQILIVQFGGNIFRTVPLSLETWLLIIAGTSLVLWIGEAVRLVKRIQMGRSL